MMEILTWTCHICGKERPDFNISVRSKPLMIEGRKCGEINIRYCNDTLDCVEGSKTFSLFKSAEAEKK